MSRNLLRGARAAAGIVGIAAMVIEARNMVRDMNLMDYEVRPYIMADGGGQFTLEHTSALLGDDEFHKNYFSGHRSGERQPLTESQFNWWTKEAEALWGTTDESGRWVPGLIIRDLPSRGEGTLAEGGSGLSTPPATPQET